MDKRLTNRELSKWLIQGNGEVKVEGSEWVYTQHLYLNMDSHKAVEEKILVRKWEDDEFQIPTRHYCLGN